MSEVKRKVRRRRRGEGEFFEVGGIDGAGAREGAVLEVEVSFRGGDKSGRGGNREGAVSEDNITGGGIIRGRDGDGVSKRDILNNGKEGVRDGEGSERGVKSAKDMVIRFIEDERVRRSRRRG